MPAADASPLEWEGLTGVPLDTDDNVSFILFGSPTFAKIDDLLGGERLQSTSSSVFHNFPNLAQTAQH